MVFLSNLYNDSFDIFVGIFGVPLELLVERTGTDSLQGATQSALRVPNFIDDVLSAMRQMGEWNHLC